MPSFTHTHLVDGKEYQLKAMDNCTLSVLRPGRMRKNRTVGAEPTPKLGYTENDP